MKLSKNYLGATIQRVGRFAMSFIPDNPSFIPIENYKTENFYKGHDTFIDAAFATEHGYRWKLGFANDSLIPDDIFTKTYYLAGFKSSDKTQNYPDGNVVDEVLDDMKVRAVCLDDGSGRGAVAFAVIDAIGLANGDVLVIRSRLADFAAKYNIVSVNIGSTHSHSCIDTQGIWSCSYTELDKRIKSKKHRSQFLDGYADKAFLELLYTKTVSAIEAAFADMKTGRLYYNETDIPEKIHDKRPGERGLKIDKDDPSILTNLSRLTFLPDDENAKQTIIVNMNAHPCTVGLETFCEDETKINFGECLSSGRQLSGDYVAYIDEAVTNAGYNLMFFNGAIMGTYTNGGHVESDPDFAPQRYLRAAASGHEIAEIVLSMKQEDAEEISPFINIRGEEVISETDNPVIIGIGKLGVTHNTFIKDKKRYLAATEVSYLEIGQKQVVLVPGEICPDLINGKYSMNEEHSVSGLAFPLPSFSEAAGFKKGKNMLVFGLMNDSVGYIVPDNDFALIRYHETLCFGSHFASALVTSFMKILKYVKA